MSVDIKVRGYHLDVYRHVNNARYLEFLEEGRWDYFDQKDFLRHFADTNLAFVVVNINISYLRPAFEGETLRIRTKMSRVGTKSAQMTQEIRVLDEQGESASKVSEAVITFCLLDQETQQAIAISGKVRGVLEELIEEDA
ncbi:MAG: thioesterase [Oceanospirillaceae bacterium]|nr:thioesterase [Oceanospirillaceae bacterium]|tara:strand:- start:829 stop:1248 length:420 start_codon:yes stop_codon:yes gene_type:complete